MNLNLNSLNNKIIKCRACPRLIKFRNKIIKNKRKQFKDEIYWGKPITGFGDPNGKILIVGLAYVWVKSDLDWIKRTVRYGSGRYQKIAMEQEK